MDRRPASLLVLLAIGAVLAMTAPVLAADGSVTIRESDERYAFAPSTTYVNVGDTVTWTNDSDAPHTVTSDSGDELASDNIGEDQTFEHTFDAVGTFDYHCTIHEYMTARVVVQAAGATPPPTHAASTATGGSGIGWTWMVILGLAAASGGLLACRRFRPAD
jgi:plastocyanin